MKKTNKDLGMLGYSGAITYRQAIEDRNRRKKIRKEEKRARLKYWFWDVFLVAVVILCFLWIVISCFVSI